MTGKVGNETPTTVSRLRIRTGVSEEMGCLMDRMGKTEKRVKRTDGKLCLPVPPWGK